MIKALVFSMFALIGIAACANRVESASGGRIVKNVVVKQVTRPAFYSGVVASYVEIHVQKRGRKLLFVQPYFDNKTKLPITGSHCHFLYKMKTIQGLVGGRAVNNFSAKVVISFDCQK